MAFEQVLCLKFGKDEQGEDRIGAGWSLAEPGYRWMVGPFSEVRLGPFAAGGDYIVILEVEPFIRPPLLSAQRLSISIGGVPFIQTEFTGGGRFGYRLPPELIAADGDLVVVFDHPDAARPSDLFRLKDHRTLAISMRQLEIWKIEGEVDRSVVEGRGGLSVAEVERRIGAPLAEFMGRFVSLGDNCEFGLVQRRCGAEPLDLLRFSNTMLPALLLGLQAGFEGLGERDDLVFRLERKAKPEYIIEEKRYGLVYHTFRYKGEIDEEQFVSSEFARLKFLVRKLVEDLRSGERVFVCKRNAPVLEEEILPLVTALNAYGPNTLLWVVQADGSHPPGSVHWVLPGLIKGYVDRFAPNENAHDFLLDSWLEICVNAGDLLRVTATARPAMPC